MVKKCLLANEDKFYKHPNEGSVVVIRYSARLADGTLFDEHAEGNELSFMTGEGN